MADESTELTGDEREALRDALVSAFPERPALAQLVRYAVDTRLEEISGPSDNLAVAAFRVVEWAESRGVLERLIGAATHENPGNPRLRAFVEGRTGPSSAADRGGLRAAASPPSGEKTMRALIIGTFCIGSLFVICLVFLLVFFQVVGAPHLWIAIVPIVLMATLAFRVTRPAFMFACL